MDRPGTELEDVFRNNRGVQFLLHREQVSHHYTDRPGNVVKVKFAAKNHEHINAFFLQRCIAFCIQADGT